MMQKGKFLCSLLQITFIKVVFIFSLICSRHEVETWISKGAASNVIERNALGEAIGRDGDYRTWPSVAQSPQFSSAAQIQFF